MNHMKNNIFLCLSLFIYTHSYAGDFLYYYQGHFLNEQDRQLLDQVLTWDPAIPLSKNSPTRKALLSNSKIMDIFLKKHPLLSDLISQNLLTSAQSYFTPLFEKLVFASGLLETQRPLWNDKNYLNYQDKNQQIIHRAAQVGSIMALKILIDLEVDINTPCKNDAIPDSYKTAVDFAQRSGHISTVEFLRAHGGLAYKEWFFTKKHSCTN